MIDIEALAREAVAKATAKAQAQAKRIENEETSSRQSKVDAWKTQQREREKSERDARNKRGMDIAEEFIAELAPLYTKLMARDDAEKLNSLRIILRPGKSDLSASYSIQIESPGTGSGPRVWHRGNIDQLSGNLEHEIRRLSEKGGFICSSPIEMMREIRKLRDYLSKAGNIATSKSDDDAPTRLNKIIEMIKGLGLLDDEIEDTEEQVPASQETASPV